MSSHKVTANLANDYIDEAVALELQVVTIADLLSAIGDPECISSESIAHIGTMVRECSDRHRILRHYFFEGALGDLDESLVTGELARLNFLYGDKRKHRGGR